MAKKMVTGQMDLFELFETVEVLEENTKGVPVRGVREPVQPGSPVMQRSFLHRGTQHTAVIAYLDYNMVYVQEWEGNLVCYQFACAKDAVDFYVKKMEVFSSDKKVSIRKEREPLKKVLVQKWTGEQEDESARVEP